MRTIEARYKGYYITGNRKNGYVCVAPYGAYAPDVYYTLKECKKAINDDLSEVKRNG